MSEKRFTWDGDILFDSLELRELGNCLEARDIVDLLNKLYEENEQLRSLVDWADNYFENDDDTDAIFKWNAYAEKLGANLEDLGIELTEWFE